MYYARLVEYRLGVEQRRIAERITQKFDKMSRGLIGFRGNVYFFDSDTGEYKALNYWNSKLDAEEAQKLLFPKLVEELQKVTNEEPSYKIFEVYDPTDDIDLLSSHTNL
ncbi:hypothetical protein [Halalkalibacter okhensis]|uniref:ABM domain-containing protein n=1 Tax=Halalkalibacter okhensis TaxID=333138 RepID=A0A0B0IF40_9BACI|nr:hypothetical protein [Halalkalibacter okhensis]KHF39492.1 hypothetical protein LQ50_14615 [Halalkalibacter okhensis]